MYIRTLKHLWKFKKTFQSIEHYQWIMRIPCFAEEQDTIVSSTFIHSSADYLKMLSLFNEDIKLELRGYGKCLLFCTRFEKIDCLILKLYTFICCKCVLNCNLPIMFVYFYIDKRKDLQVYK
uniref:Uncharacterized protein n=1 Tax=Cacopsylla melanoneura TaxID=428564 RepID=A0A8D8X8M0_9HEMI